MEENYKSKFIFHQTTNCLIEFGNFYIQKSLHCYRNNAATICCQKKSINETDIVVEGGVLDDL